VTIVVLIAIMALVGGATRLTESGLSIVEWNRSPDFATAQPGAMDRGVRRYKTIPNIAN